MSVEAETSSVSDGNLAATYALVYNFLRSKGHDKAANSLKKSVKDIIVLREDVPVEGGPSLDEIVKAWKAEQEATSSSSSEYSDSESSASGASPDSPTPGFSTPKIVPPPIAVKTAANGVPPARLKPSSQISNQTLSSGKESGSESSSGSESESESASRASSKPKPSRSESDDSDSSSDSAAPKTKSKLKAAPNDVASKSGVASSSSSSSSSSSADGSDTDEKPPAKKIIKAKTEERSSDVLAVKRRRTSDSGAAVVTATVLATDQDIGNGSVTTESSKNGTNGDVRRAKQPRKSNTPFQRIKAEQVSFVDDRLKDNSFTAKGGSTNDYGERAHRDLIVTRGAGFRKEKNKKKRGSYRGGEITMQSHSIKFD